MEELLTEMAMEKQAIKMVIKGPSTEVAMEAVTGVALGLQCSDCSNHCNCNDI